MFIKRDYSFIFVNGINNTEDDSINTKRTLETKSGIRGDYVWNNADMLSVIAHPNCNAQSWNIQGTVKILVKKLMDKISSGGHVCLIVHSHGAVVAAEALKKIDQRFREYIEYYGFGVINYIPKFHARKAINIEGKTDWVSEFGKAARTFYKASIESNKESYDIEYVVNDPWDAHSFKTNYLDLAAKKIVIFQKNVIKINEAKERKFIAYVFTTAIVVIFAASLLQKYF